MSDYYPDPPLFSAARMAYRQPKVLARRSDRPTSVAAAADAGELLHEHERLILDALAAGPGNKDELASRCGLTEQQVIRRMARLERTGRVVDTGTTRRTTSGRMAVVWRRATQR